MKKILSLILACVLCFTAIPVSAFADTVSTDDLFGVILDADGNVVEYLPMPKGDTYVNKVFVIPAGGNIISLQYTTTQNFFFGYSTRDYDKKTTITNPNCSFDMCIELSNTLGGGNRVIYMDHISKNPLIGADSLTAADSIYLGSDETYYNYCNGKIVNTSSVSATVRIVVVRDFNWDNDDPRDYL